MVPIDDNDELRRNLEQRGLDLCQAGAIQGFAIIFKESPLRAVSGEYNDPIDISRLVTFQNVQLASSPRHFTRQYIDPFKETARSLHLAVILTAPRRSYS